MSISDGVGGTLPNPGLPTVTPGNRCVLATVPPKLSIDKLAVTMSVPKKFESVFDRRFFRFLNALANGCSEMKKHELYEFSFKHDGVLIQWGGVFERGTTGSFRLEWNPADSMHETLLPHVFAFFGENKLRGATFTRIDVAIDYGRPLNPLLFYDANKRKGDIYYEKGFGVQTHYIGSRSSSLKFRIYNKAVERLQNAGEAVRGDWWRVESQDSRGYYFGQSVANPFGRRVKGGSVEGLVYCSEYLPLSGQDFFFWHFVEQYGVQCAMSYLDKFSRCRMKKKLVRDETFVPPFDVFEKQFLSVWNPLKLKLLDWSQRMEPSTSQLLRDCGMVA